jgi:hypothetical protein
VHSTECTQAVKCQIMWCTLRCTVGTRLTRTGRAAAVNHSSSTYVWLSCRAAVIGGAAGNRTRRKNRAELRKQLNRRREKTCGYAEGVDGIKHWLHVGAAVMRSTPRTVTCEAN